MKHLNITVRGKVQGVWFRKETHLAATRLGVSGTVENRPDGTVYIEAEAEEAVMCQFVDWCHEGPKLAVVAEVVIEEEDLKGFKEFKVLAEPSDYLS